MSNLPLRTDHVLAIIEIELMNIRRSGVDRGEPNAKSIKFRSALTWGSNDWSGRLKLTGQAWISDFGQQTTNKTIQIKTPLWMM
jgi:hypothetical protein